VILTPFLLLPLLAAILYVCAVLMIKRAVDANIDTWRTSFVCNIITALTYAPLLVLGGTFHAELLWQPAAAGVLLIAGQFLTFRSVEGGHVSVATPMLSLKVVLVALFTSLFLSQQVLPRQWVAAVLSTFAIMLLNRRGSAGQVESAGTGRTILYSGLAAMAFAMFDVLVQKWSPLWGAGYFLPVMLLFSALLSFLMIPRFTAPLNEIPGPAWPWLTVGSFLMGLQSVLFVTAIAIYGNGTAANVVYSSRGLWSVIMVWAVGHWFANRESHVSPDVFRGRVMGAVCMTVAVALVFV